jgi:hypothetical protein
LKRTDRRSAGELDARDAMEGDWVPSPTRALELGSSLVDGNESQPIRLVFWQRVENEKHLGSKLRYKHYNNLAFVSRK